MFRRCCVKRAVQWLAAAVAAWRANLLVVSQVALSMILLVGAGLLMRSFANLQNVSLGIQSAQCSGDGYHAACVALFFDQRE